HGGAVQVSAQETARAGQALRLCRRRHIARRGSPRESVGGVEAMTRRLAVAAFLICMCALTWSFTKVSGQARQTAQKSVGRGWPVPVSLAKYHGYPESEFVGAVTPGYYQTSATATGGKAPAGVQPLPHDIFTSKDFYVDRALWMDKRYYRCNSPIALDSIWGDYSSGPGALENGNPATAAWGHCERDYPRENIVSPYPFKTAQEHYEALLAETKSHG